LRREDGKKADSEETMITKRFHLGDILSITTGKLVSLQNIDGVFEILNFMTGDGLHMHQLSRVADECKPFGERWTGVIFWGRTSLHFRIIVMSHRNTKSFRLAQL